MSGGRRTEQVEELAARRVHQAAVGAGGSVDHRRRRPRRRGTRSAAGLHGQVLAAGRPRRADEEAGLATDLGGDHGALARKLSRSAGRHDQTETLADLTSQSGAVSPRPRRVAASHVSPPCQCQPAQLRCETHAGLRGCARRCSWRCLGAARLSCGPRSACRGTARRRRRSSAICCTRSCGRAGLAPIRSARSRRGCHDHERRSARERLIAEDGAKGESTYSSEIMAKE